MKQWIEVNMTFSAMEEKGLINPGVWLRLASGEEHLIGTVNLNGGSCDCCPSVRCDSVVKYYREIHEPT